MGVPGSQLKRLGDLERNMINKIGCKHVLCATIFKWKFIPSVGLMFFSICIRASC